MPRPRRALVTGAAGFLGSHLSERLLVEGWEVVGLDSLLTSSTDNLEGCLGHQRFTFEQHDVTNYLHVPGPLDWVLHFASPASPRDYLDHPIHTMKVGAIGTLRSMGLTRAKGAGMLLASTSEVYGDPVVHPQPESYLGNVNPVGPRAVYDEAKRYAEAMVAAYRRVHHVPTKIVRIFNTYGPRMRIGDGRAIPSFIDQALRETPMTVHGDGEQTRSFCYVDDLVEGIWRLLNSDLAGPVNMGSTEEVSVLEVARRIRELTRSSSEIVFVDRMEDDPYVRRPDITLAGTALGWTPTTPLYEGLARTIQWSIRTRRHPDALERQRALTP